MNEYRYTIILYPNPEQGGYTVTVPALSGYVTEGETFEEAIVMAKEAIQLYIESLISDGEPIPTEQSIPKQLLLRWQPSA